MKWAEVMVIFSKQTSHKQICHAFDPCHCFSVIFWEEWEDQNHSKCSRYEQIPDSSVQSQCHFALFTFPSDTSMELSEPWHELISVFFRGLSISTSGSYLYVLTVISESFHYVPPFPSTSFSIILTFQFIISWFPTYKFWRFASSPNTPRYLTSLKLFQITHSFSLRFQLQVSPVPQSCPLSVTAILSLGWTLLLTHSCTNSGTEVSEGTLPLLLLTHCQASAAETFCIFPHWLGKCEVCSEGSRGDKYFIAPHCEKSCNCFSMEPKLQIFC